MSQRHHAKDELVATLNEPAVCRGMSMAEYDLLHAVVVGVLASEKSPIEFWADRWDDACEDAYFSKEAGVRPSATTEYERAEAETAMLVLLGLAHYTIAAAENRAPPALRQYAESLAKKGTESMTPDDVRDWT
jgi:hypothetical protein